jgi:3-deoxy-D-manno-octulosonate 8-phosphate phosphatase (KDO 8-P phosphatase)
MVLNRLKSIKLLLIDVDGVLTDGGIFYNDNGTESKAFNVKDGLGIKLLMEAGIHVGIITGRRSNALFNRCRELGIDLIYDGVSDKADALNRVLERTGLSAEEVACMGDDLPDLALMRRTGLSIAVADAHVTVRESADMTTSAKGGHGAVREACDAILKAKGIWESILKQFSV